MLGVSFGLLFNLLWCFITQPGLSIHQADSFFFQLLDSKICHIRGILGGGKTSLAFMLCMFLRSMMPDQFRYVASNVPCDTAIYPPPNLDNGVRNTIIILDEAGTYVGNRTWEVNPTEFYQGLRKFETVVLCPSKAPLDVRLSELWCQPVFKLSNFAWFYWWGYSLGGQSKQGGFFIWRPNEIFETFSTGLYSTTDGGIIDLFRVTLQQAAEDLSGWKAYRVDTDPDRIWADIISERDRQNEEKNRKKRWGSK